METFIVRIYRGVAAPAHEPAGTVERVGSGDRVGFSGREQLLDCLFVALLDRDCDHGTPRQDVLPKRDEDT